MDEKRCGKCGETKPLSGFYRNAARGDGLSGYCIPCQRASDDATEQRQRAELLALLGGVCRECGFSNPLALQVDHVNGGGAAQRKAGEHAVPRVLLRLAKANPAAYQLLCANCNVIKRMTMGEHKGARVYERVILTERRAPDPYRERRRYRGAEERRDALLALVAERRPVETSPVRLPMGSWSRFWLRCLGCQRDDRRHAAEGLCTACNARVKGYTRRVPREATEAVTAT